MNATYDSLEDTDTRGYTHTLEQYLLQNPSDTDSDHLISSNKELINTKPKTTKRLSRFIKLGSRNVTVQTEVQDTDEEVGCNISMEQDQSSKQSKSDSHNYKTPKVIYK